MFRFPTVFRRVGVTTVRRNMLRCYGSYGYINIPFEAKPLHSKRSGNQQNQNKRDWLNCTDSSSMCRVKPNYTNRTAQSLKEGKYYASRLYRKNASSGQHRKSGSSSSSRRHHRSGTRRHHKSGSSRRHSGSSRRHAGRPRGSKSHKSGRHASNSSSNQKHSGSSRRHAGRPRGSTNRRSGARSSIKRASRNAKH